MYIYLQNVSAIPLKLRNKFSLRSSLLNTKWKLKVREIAEENLPSSRLILHNPQTHMSADRFFIVICCAPFRIYCRVMYTPPCVFSAKMELQSGRKFLSIFPLYSGRSFTTSWTLSRMTGLPMAIKRLHRSFWTAQNIWVQISLKSAPL